MSTEAAEVKKGIVVMLDALGVRNLSSKEAKAFLNNRGKLLTQLGRKLEPLDSSAARVTETAGPPQFVTFQDTILVTWEIRGPAHNLLPHIANLLRRTIPLALQNGLRLRGAVAVGEYIQDENSVLGPAIADAASWYEQAQWIGIVATPHCGMQLDLLYETKFRRRRPHALDPWYVQYEVPLKEGRRETLWAVSWPAQYRKKKYTLGSSDRGKFLRHVAKFSVPLGTESKYWNTITFFDWYDANIGDAPCEQEGGDEQKA